MKAKFIVYTFFLSVFLGFLIICSVVFINDPFQIFHKHWIRKSDMLISNMRIQAAGIINNYTFDSVILGSSVLENTSSDEASRKLGGNFINISLSGSDFYERSFVLHHLFEKHKIKKILYSLDSYSLNTQRKRLEENLTFLYDKNCINDFKAYLTISGIKSLVSFSANNRHFMNLDRPNAWYDDPDQMARYGGLDQWFEAKNNNQVKGAFKEIVEVSKKLQKGESRTPYNSKKRLAMARQYLDTYILSFARTHSDTEFILVLPPYSRIEYAMQSQFYKEDFEIYKAMVLYLVLQSSYLANVKVFGWGNYPFVDNIANYKDPHHYEYKINSWMLSAIRRNEGLLLTSNVNEYLNTFSKKALAFNIVEFAEKIDVYLRASD